MDESSSIGEMNSSLSMSSMETVNTSTSFEKDHPIPDYTKLNIIASISNNLKDIMEENVKNDQIKYVKNDIFYFSHIPSISLNDYLNRIFKYTKMNISTLIMAIIYIDSFCQYNKYILSMNNIYRILLTSCLLSMKFNEDVSISSKYYSKIVGIPFNQIKKMEYIFCIKFKFSFFVGTDIFQKYLEYFSKNNTLEEEKKAEKESEEKKGNYKEDKTKSI